MRNKTIVIILFLLCLLLSSCGGKSLGSGIYIPSFKDVSKIASNIYIGEIISVGSEVESREESSNTPLIKIQVKIEHAYKGKFQEGTQIDDYVLYSFKDFLKSGDKYIFCTGIDYEAEGVLEKGVFQPYSAVKILDDESLEIYNWSRFEVLSKYDQNHVEPSPKKLNEIEKVFDESN